MRLNRFAFFGGLGAECALTKLNARLRKRIKKFLFVANRLIFSGIQMNHLSLHWRLNGKIQHISFRSKSDFCVSDCSSKTKTFSMTPNPRFPGIKLLQSQRSIPMKLQWLMIILNRGRSHTLFVPVNTLFFISCFHRRGFPVSGQKLGFREKPQCCGIFFPESRFLMPTLPICAGMRRQVIRK